MNEQDQRKTEIVKKPRKEMSSAEVMVDVAQQTLNVLQAYLEQNRTIDSSQIEHNRGYAERIRARAEKEDIPELKAVSEKIDKALDKLVALKSPRKTS